MYVFTFESFYEVPHMNAENGRMCPSIHRTVLIIIHVKTHFDPTFVSM